MVSKSNFVKATDKLNTIWDHVPAYYFRRSFDSCGETAKLTIAVCGFYELFFNGKKITKGFLSPYISNLDHYIYYDEYELTLDRGENVIGVLMGNGLRNNPGGQVWKFGEAEFRGAPAFSLSLTDKDGKELLVSDESFKTSPSPIRSDDYRFGEHYDANFEIDGWCDKGFDDTNWGTALHEEPPKGEFKFADVAPIVKQCEIAPIDIIKMDNGSFIYDFGQSNAGICRLKIKGEKGQKIELHHTDWLKDDGDLCFEQVWFMSDVWERSITVVHCDSYICKGEGVEVYEPTFTYHGFRYVRVDGITPEQATPELLTFLVYHTELETMGDFTCSDEVTNKLQEITRRSIVSNFHHFPTDCPQREKNGWTADAQLTSEAALINFNPERNYREWLFNVRHAQREDGMLPGIIPTGGWGYHWGNGPAWDGAMINMPYFMYKYRGDTQIIKESVDAWMLYLRYLRGRVDENGLLSIGLGDWCHTGQKTPKSPLIFTDTVISMDLARKISEMLGVIGLENEAEFARKEFEAYRAAARANLINFDTMSALGDCQTSQAMSIFYDLFEESEKPAALEVLLKYIHDEDDHFDVGVLGGRVIFRVLSDFGYADLAHKMITRDDGPSYGNILKLGATTLWEKFKLDYCSSVNHHFWGDISAWFISHIGGIKFNPSGRNVNEVMISPDFITSLEHASAYHIAPAGKIAVSWKRDGDAVVLDVEIPDGMSATMALKDGYTLDNGDNSCRVKSGSYKVTRK